MAVLGELQIEWVTNLLIKQALLKEFNARKARNKLFFSCISILSENKSILYLRKECQMAKE